MTINRGTRMAALVAIPALVTGLAGLTLAGPKGTQGDQTLRVFIPDQPPTHLADAAPLDDPATTQPEYSAGDALLFRDPVLNPDTGDDLGSAVTRVQVVENPTAGDAAFVLDCTVRLADGNLAFYGADQLAHLATTTQFAVIGGTGTYAGTTGMVTGTPTEVGGRAGHLLTFELGAM